MVANVVVESPEEAEATEKRNPLSKKDFCIYIHRSCDEECDIRLRRCARCDTICKVHGDDL